MPEYIKTKGGYFYKIINGKKKRISLDEYKRRNKMSGGAGGGGGGGGGGEDDGGSADVYNLYTFNKVYSKSKQHFTYPEKQQLNNFLRKNYILDITVLADEINKLYNTTMPLSSSAKMNLYHHYNNRVKNNSQSISLILYNLRYNKNNGYNIAICLYLSLINSIIIFEKILQIIFDKGKEINKPNKLNIIANIKKSIEYMIKTHIKDDTKKAEFMAVLNSIIVNRNGNGGGGGSVI